MRLPLALNAVFGSTLIIVLVFANYVRKFNTDRFQRMVFCGLLLFTFISMVGDSACLLLEGIPGRTVSVLLYASGFTAYLFQVLAYYYIVVFIDYMVFKDQNRSKTIIVIVYVISLIHAFVLALNIKYHFYFFINEDNNIFTLGEKYFLLLVITCCPAFFAVYDVIISHKTFRKSFLFMLFLLLVFPSAGSVLDIVYGSVKLIWPCMTAALLYAYFFIVQSDARIDNLTGIGNRFSFNEFTDRLSRRGSGESWAIVMIDMDHFKQINDTLGHQEGDNALCDIASIIRKCIRGSDFAARYGGDEFVLATKTGNNIESLMRRIQDEIDQHNAKQIRPFKLEISYGYDVFTADGKWNIEEFFSHIDNLMYKHKQERRRSSDKKTEAAR
jgi:diguanylate cyclase (GGDEF)-like protein